LKIFAIPGLGVDGRIYQRLSTFIPQLEIIEWLEPLKGEDLEYYTHRMAERIKAHKGPKIIMGTSFGGVVAQEISTFVPINGLILLSTFKKNDARPWFFSIGEKIPLYQLLRGKIRYHFLPWLGPFIGVPDKDDQDLLQDMFMSASIPHRIWGAGEIVKWKGVQLQVPFVHIHGKEDRVFHAENISEAIFIENTGHFMLHQQAERVARYIKDWLSHEIFPGQSASEDRAPSEQIG